MVYPVFIISLDVELLWGFVLSPQSKRAKLLRADPQSGRGTIKFLLNTFEKYKIPATWAIVGHLFLEHCQKEHNMLPKWHDWDPGTNIHESPLYYGKDIIKEIMTSQVKHEIGYHSFSHVPFSKISREIAEVEIDTGISLAKELGLTLKSFVFIGNDIGHIGVLKERGFEIYRGHTLTEGNIEQSLLSQIFHGVINRMIAEPTEPVDRDGIWEIPASLYFLRPPISVHPSASQ